MAVKERNWYHLEKIETAAEGGISAAVVVPAGSPWFSGHFPDNPILPAIAQLAIVLDVAGQGSGRELRPASIQRTKYRRIIRPDETVDIVLSPVGNDPGDKTMTYSFQLAVNNEIACKGAMKTLPAE